MVEIGDIGRNRSMPAQIVGSGLYLGEVGQDSPELVNKGPGFSARVRPNSGKFYRSLHKFAKKWPFCPAAMSGPRVSLWLACFRVECVAFDSEARRPHHRLQNVQRTCSGNSPSLPPNASSSDVVASGRQDVASAPSLTSRILGSNMHFASLLAFKCQFAAVHAPVRKVYNWVVWMVVCAPWQAFLATLLTS